MALKIPVVDRIPTYPGRVTLTPVSGQENTYDLVRADDPIEEGTPLNKALFDQKVYGLTESVTVYVNGNTGSDSTGDGTSTLPFATIQAAVDALPKYMNGYVATVDIADGTYEERVNVDGFTGGRLVLGVAGRAVTIRALTVRYSTMVWLNIPNITYSSSFPDTLIYITAGSVVFIGNSLTINCNGSSPTGIGVERGSVLITPAGVTITVNGSTIMGIYATTGAKIVLNQIAGSNNTGAAIAVEHGSTVSYATRTISATTANLTSTGGRIYSGGQSSIPNY